MDYEEIKALAMAQQVMCKAEHVQPCQITACILAEDHLKYESPVISDADDEAIGRRILESTFDAMGEFPPWEQRDSMDVYRRVFRGCVAATTAEKKERKKLRQSYGENAGMYINTLHIVASAFSARSTESDCSDYHPYSNAGIELLQFARLCITLDCLKNADMLNDDDSMFGEEFGKIGLLLLKEENRPSGYDPGSPQSKILI